MKRAASRSPREGVDSVTVQELLGHSNINTTYAESNDEANHGARRSQYNVGTSTRTR